ncbi:MAG TPA: hypothetical protein VFI24_11260 [Pyrinomonadaceae bacterium]|nr:hypothetical protein [Pyrinomonadaceae bacterium]
MEAFQVFDRPASLSGYSVAGRLLFVESNDPELRSLIVELFAGWQLTPVPDPHRSPNIRINFRCGETPQEVRSDLNYFEVAEGGKCYTDGADFYLALGNALVHLRNGDPVAVDVSFRELPVARDPMLARVTSFAVCAGLRRFGLFDLHSAGVVNPHNGRGVLIVGRSGSGKSTLAVQLATSEWSYLSDDELLLSLDDGAVEARGFRSFFAMSAEGGPFKQCFEPDTVFGAQRAPHVLPGIVLFTSLNHQSESRLSKLTQTETMMRLIRACPWATYDRSIASANLEVLSTLARQADGFDLAAGRDLLVPGFAADLISNCSRQN